MNRSTRMMLLNSGKDKETRRRRMGVEYEDWTPVDHYGAHMPTTAPYMPMEPESAFYDDRGARHYDNGRYAPRNAYGAPESVRRYSDGRFAPMGAYGEPESVRRYSDGRFAPRSDYMPMEPWSGYSDGRMDTGRREGAGPRMIGFGRSWGDEDMRSDATMPNLIEMDHLRGRRDQQGMAMGYGMPRFDREMAMEWTKGMENADGTTGPHWTMEQTNKAMKDYKVDCDPVKFYVALNATYSDMCEVFKKHNVSTLDMYVDCALAFWIEDKDAVPDKLSAYFNYVVEK